MPWIQVTAPPPEVGNPSRTGVEVAAWAARCAEQVAGILRLDPHDVIVLVHLAEAASSAGAVVTVTGRRRDDSDEVALSELLITAVGRWAQIPADRVALVRN